MKNSDERKLTTTDEVTVTDVIWMQLRMYLSSCINNARGPLLSIGETLVDYGLEWLDEWIRK